VDCELVKLVKDDTSVDVLTCAKRIWWKRLKTLGLRFSEYMKMIGSMILVFFFLLQVLK
jgi:hypothetical protein